MNFINCVRFHYENLSERKEFAPSGSEFFHLRVVPYSMENHFWHIRLPLLNVTIFITHMRNCVMGASPMQMNLVSCNILYSSYDKLFQTRLFQAFRIKIF